MDSQTSSQANPAQPQPETLQPRSADAASSSAPAPTAAQAAQTNKPKRRLSYRPSHKATLIGMAVVIAILAVNAAVIGLVLKKQNNTDNLAKGQVTISSDALNKLGVNRSPLGSSGALLTVAPDAQFKGKLAVNGPTTLSGNVTLNNQLTDTSASINQLQAGNTQFGQLNVNGDGTLSTLNLRKDLAVAGVTQLQGAVTISQLLTVNNNVNILGNLAIGGTFSAHALAANSSLTIGGHVITTGAAPKVSAGSGVGSNGTVSISGNDAAGTVDVNIGVGGGSGTVAVVTFVNKYATTPHIVLTPVGAPVGTYYIVSRSTSGFSIGVQGLGPGGYGFDYMVEQ